MTIYILSSLSFLNKLKFTQPNDHEYFGKVMFSLDCMIDLSLCVISVRELKGLEERSKCPFPPTIVPIDF